MDLPSGYTQLEYIESTGTQYIDTGFKPNQNSRVVMVAQMTVISGAAFYFGARATGYVDSFAVLYSNSVKAMRSAYGSENLTFTTTDYTARVIIDKNKTSCKLGTETLNHTATTFQNIHNLYLFASNEFGTVGSLAKMRLYSCQIYDNDALIRDYIPCATADGQVGLYDAVNGVFYGNAGTGNFLRGKVVNPVLPDGFVQIEYIESSGTQYIDTGFKPDSNTKIVAEMAYVRFDNNTCGLVGSSGSAGIEFYYYSSTSSQRYIYMFNSTDNNSANAPLALGTKLYIDLAKTNATVTVDGTVYTMTPSSATNFTASYTLHIHTLWRNGAALLPSSSRTYSFMVYDNGTLVREYIPCVSNSGEVGLYDIIGKQFYGNAGTGKFSRGKVLNPELPKGFSEVEYIQATGTQYIDTGFSPAYNSRVIAEISDAAAGSCIFGARDTNSGTSPKQFVSYIRAETEFRAYYFGTNQTATISDIAAHTVIDQNANITNCFGVTITNTAVSSGVVTNSLYLFALNSVGETTAQATAKLYFCQIYDDGTLVHEYLPCISDGNEVGLYDVVSKQFYGNAGSGSFLRGKMLHPKLPSGFVRTEYIESTGTQYVDTGFVPNQDTHVFCEAVFTPETAVKFLFGARTSTSSNQFMLACDSSGKYTSGYGGESKKFTAAHSTTDIIFVDKDKETTTITHTDGTTASVVGTESTFTAPNNMILFGCNTKGTVTSSKAKIYSFYIYDNGVLVREFVPCKNSGDVGGLYDVLNGVFYGNAGSGEFLLGAEIDVEPDPEPIPPEEFPLMVYDRTYTDLLRAKELATIGYANMTDAEREEWNGGLRGAYNAIDFNRVENAVLFLCVVLKELPQEIRDFAAELGVSWDGFFDVPYSTDDLNLKAKNTWKAGEIPTKVEKSRYLSNVIELRRTLDYETDMLPASMDGLTINGANAIEKALAFLHTEIDKFRQMRKTQIKNTAAAWFYAGEIYANEV